MIQYFWRVKLEGVVVASGFAPTRQTRHNQLHYYSCVYAQDGDIVQEIRETNTRWRRPK